MASRSRKRRKPAAGGTRPATTARTGAPDAAAQDAVAEAPAPETPAPRTRRPRVDADARHGPTPRLRGEARDEMLRAGIVPLQPGERPVPLKIAVVIALLIAVANLVLYLSGYDVPGQSQSVGGLVAVLVVFGACAWGMWAGRYWALLGFQTLLAITAIIAGLSALVASNVLAVLLCVVVLVGAGVLFYRLVRVMARMQAPQRPTRS